MRMAEEKKTEDMKEEVSEEVTEKEETEAQTTEQESDKQTDEGETKEETPEKKRFGKKKDKKDKKDEKIEELTDQLKRQLAEFDNYRKRTEKEKASMYVVGAKEIVEKILPIVDNLPRRWARQAWSRSRLSEKSSIRTSITR